MPQAYKVPQNVEAEDRILGPFTFRQFIFLLIVTASIAIAYGLSQIYPALFLIPMPITLFFLVLSIPIRRNQPIEVYLGALLNYYLLKPRIRLWKPQDVEELIHIETNVEQDQKRTKGLSQQQASSQIDFLSKIVDSSGKLVASQSGTWTYNLRDQSSPEIDVDLELLKSFDSRLQQKETEKKNNITNIISGYAKSTQTTPKPREGQTVSQPIAPEPFINENGRDKAAGSDQDLRYNPYPKEMVQAIIQPVEDNYKIRPEQKNIPKPVDDKKETGPYLEPSVAEELANSDDISVEGVAQIAKHIKAKQDLITGVYIKLHDK